MAALTIAADEDELAHTAAEHVTTLIEQAIAARASAIVSLTGGSTPRLLYSLLADHAQVWRARIEWPRVHLFWGDERHVPPDHPDSNFGMANEALVRHIPIPAAQVHRMRGELPDAREAAREYERELRDGFTAAGRTDRTFDVMLLGLGEDAHIASIFPGSPLISRGADLVRSANEDRVAAIWAPHLNARRITLTPAALVDARAIVIVVAGGKKADAVHAALEAPLDISRHPAQLLREAGDRVIWHLDRAAARRVEPASGRSPT
jgi:6-phosphogluconolactonase